MGRGWPGSRRIRLAERDHGRHGRRLERRHRHLGREPRTIAGLRAQRVDGSGAPQWGASGVEVVGIANSNPIPTDVIPDGAGAAYFLWEDSRNGATPHTDPDIFAQRVSAVGALWAADGIAVCTSGGEQFAATGAIDGVALGLVVAWQDQRGLDTDIYAST